VATFRENADRALKYIPCRRAGKSLAGAVLLVYLARLVDYSGILNVGDKTITPPQAQNQNHALLQKTGGAMPPEIGASRTKAGTVNAVAVALFKHDMFTKGLAKATQGPFRRTINRFREFKTPGGRLYDENHVATIMRERIVDFLKGKSANAQKNNLKAVRFLIRFAMSEGELASDPAGGVELVRAAKSMGHVTWKLPQFAQYRECHQLGTIARLALELMLKPLGERMRTSWSSASVVRFRPSAFATNAAPPRRCDPPARA
jgi:hypothetical protein